MNQWTREHLRARGIEPRSTALPVASHPLRGAYFEQRAEIERHRAEKLGAEMARIEHRDREAEWALIQAEGWVEP